MLDSTGTGDSQGFVAKLAREHDSSHGGTGHDHPHCHATHAEMVGGSTSIKQTLEGILSNPVGTPHDRQWAQWWLERNHPKTESPSLWGTITGWFNF